MPVTLLYHSLAFEIYHSFASQQWGNLDRDSLAENPQLSKVLSSKPGVGEKSFACFTHCQYTFLICLLDSLSFVCFSQSCYSIKGRETWRVTQIFTCGLMDCFILTRPCGCPLFNIKNQRIFSTRVLLLKLSPASADMLIELTLGQSVAGNTSSLTRHSGSNSRTALFDPVALCT